MQKRLAKTARFWLKIAKPGLARKKSKIAVFREWMGEFA